MKRLAVALMLLLVAHATPALAGPGDAVEIELKGVQRGAVVEGTLELSATASSAAGIKRIEITVNEQVAASTEPPNLKQSADVSYGWVTPLQVDSTELASNGEYAITATAIANGGADAVTGAKVIVDNPAATPEGVSLDTTPEGVAISWEPNTEPDLLGYQIERGIDGDFEILGYTTDTSVVDPVGPGTYSYRIVAIRSSAARSAGRPSAPSSEVLISIQGSAVSSAGGDDLKGANGLATDRSFRTESGAIAPRGLPAGAALPGAAGLPRLPVVEENWGTYEEQLPYDLPEGGIPLSATRARSEGSSTLIPADGLRWVAAGTLMLALATLLRLIGQRLEPIAGPAPLPRPARSLKL